MRTVKLGRDDGAGPAQGPAAPGPGDRRRDRPGDRCRGDGRAGPGGPLGARWRGPGLPQRPVRCGLPRRPGGPAAGAQLHPARVRGAHPRSDGLAGEGVQGGARAGGPEGAAALRLDGPGAEPRADRLRRPRRPPGPRPAPGAGPEAPGRADGAGLQPGPELHPRDRAGHRPRGAARPRPAPGPGGEVDRRARDGAGGPAGRPRGGGQPRLAPPARNLARGPPGAGDAGLVAHHRQGPARDRQGHPGGLRPSSARRSTSGSSTGLASGPSAPGPRWTTAWT